MNKVIKYNDVEGVKRLQDFAVEEFSTVNRGLTPYTLQPFDDVTSVQDQSLTASMRGRQEVTFNPAPSMLSRSADALDMDVFANADFEASGGPHLFASFDDDVPPRRSGLFSTYESEETEATKRRPANEEETLSAQFAKSAETAERIEPVDVTDGFQEISLGDVLSSDEVSLPKSQQALYKKQIDEHAEAAKAAQDERDQLKQSLNDKEKELQELRQKLQEMENALPKQVENARQDGFAQGKAASADENNHKYEAEKQDYLQTVQNSWNEALAEIKKYDDAVKSMDEQIPEIVIGYLRELIGAERKLNDEFVVNLIKSAIGKLTDTQQLLFTINPDDADIVTEKFPQYGVSIDQSIPKGNVRIQTKTGDVDLSVNAWIDSLEKQINEQLKSS